MLNRITRTSAHADNGRKKPESPGVKHRHRFYKPYTLILCTYVIFLVFAFIADSPAEIVRGLWRILCSRSILISDYVAIGGIGAMLVNSVLVGAISILLLVSVSAKPNGAIIMGILLNTGFAFFGKNLFNTIPITLGVWLYSKYQKEPFINYSLAALLCSTLSPVVSEICFMGSGGPVNIILGMLTGLAVGFIMPAISSFVVRLHNGYMLYNFGFAGGLIAMFLSLAMRSLGVEFLPEQYWSEGNNALLAAFLYCVSLVMIVSGFIPDGPRAAFKKYRSLLSHSGRLLTDFYLLHSNAAFLNMGILCAFSTTLVLFLGGSLNGPTMGGVLTIMAFGSCGKHLRNVVPVLTGAVISTYINMWDPTSPTNMLAILFSTGLAPIAGYYGWPWGLLAGLLHVNIANYIGTINSGLNLYNNGFAGGFVALFLIPLIEAFRRRDKN